MKKQEEEWDKEEGSKEGVVREDRHTGWLIEGGHESRYKKKKEK